MINHILVMITRIKKVLGKSKDEHDGQIFTLHIGLKPKMYCCETDDKNVLKKVKALIEKL